ncbi:MAG: fimbrillin family protein [Muribaculaceae bacterium]|nr:fimbrillin family protein [Muribaculaceae bacterium]
MKKTSTSILVLALAAMSLASCSQDEPAAVNRGRAIDFRSAMSSRATEINNGNLTDINVAAFMGDQLFFPVMEYTKGSDGFFTSSTEYYWPGDNSELSFYAYAPANPGGTVNITPDAKTMADFSPAENIADQIDFVTAYATGTKDANETAGVPLTFNHQLAQIEIQAKTANDVYTYKVSGVRIGEPVSKGSFDFATSAWTEGTDKAIYTETYDDAKTLTADAVNVMGEGGNAMILPQQLTAWDPTGDGSNTAQGAYLAIKLQITTTETGVQVYPFPSNGDCQWAAIPIDTKLEAGKKYIYTLDLTHGAGYVDPHDPVPGTPVLGGPIKFTVDVVDWVDTPSDLPMTTK